MDGLLLKYYIFCIFWNQTCHINLYIIFNLVFALTQLQVKHYMVEASNISILNLRLHDYRPSARYSFYYLHKSLCGVEKGASKIFKSRIIWYKRWSNRLKVILMFTILVKTLEATGKITHNFIFLTQLHTSLLRRKYCTRL